MNRIYVLHDNAVCPRCKGNAKRQRFDNGDLVFVCCDCKAKWIITDFGDAEKEFIVREIHDTNT